MSEQKIARYTPNDSITEGTRFVIALDPRRVLVAVPPISGEPCTGCVASDVGGNLCVKLPRCGEQIFIDDTEHGWDAYLKAKLGEE